MSGGITRISIDSASAFPRSTGAQSTPSSGIRATRGVLFSVLLAVPFWAMVGLLFF